MPKVRKHQFVVHRKMNTGHERVGPVQEICYWTFSDCSTIELVILTFKNTSFQSTLTEFNLVKSKKYLDAVPSATPQRSSQ